MKKILVILTIVLSSLPTIVSANIMCNDGTISPSCGACTRGCCSHHGGCADDYDYTYSSSSNKRYKEVYNPNIVFEEPKEEEEEKNYTFEVILGIGALFYFGIRDDK